jgi:hypothetical protein
MHVEDVHAKGSLITATRFLPQHALRGIAAGAPSW